MAYKTGPVIMIQKYEERENFKKPHEVFLFKTIGRVNHLLHNEQSGQMLFHLQMFRCFRQFPKLHPADC